jgi:hypothetical protein
MQQFSLKHKGLALLAAVLRHKPIALFPANLGYGDRHSQFYGFQISGLCRPLFWDILWLENWRCAIKQSLREKLCLNLF